MHGRGRRAVGSWGCAAAGAVGSHGVSISRGWGRFNRVFDCNLAWYSLDVCSGESFWELSLVAVRARFGSWGVFIS